METGGAAQPSVSRAVAITRVAGFAALVTAAILTLAITGSLPSPDEVRDWGEDLGDAAYFAFIPLFVAVNFVITWPILAGAAGLLFGTAVGVPLTLAAVTAASVTQMFVSRRLAAGHHGRLLPKRTRPIEEFLTRNGAVAVMESRIVPLVPWGIVNYSAGLIHFRYRDLALGTIVGGAPKVFAYVALGGSLSDLTSPEAIVAVSVLVVLAVTGALFLRRQIALGRP